MDESRNSRRFLADALNSARKKWFDVFATSKMTRITPWQLITERIEREFSIVQKDLGDN